VRLPSAETLQTLTQSLRRLDRRVQLAAAGAGVLLLGAVGFAVLGPGLASRGEPAATPAAAPTATPAPTPFRPRATPPGTPAPRPSTFVLISSSIPVKVPPAPRPTATPEPGLWRLEGYVVDEAGQPIENVCVVIGPVGCQTFTTKTDERGHWFLDIASAPVTPLTQVNFDFYFEIPGRETVWLRMTPNSSTVFNLVLRKT
jgi:hypothetical protein